VCVLLFAGDLSASDTSLVELVERQRRPLPQDLMPLPPSSNRDSPMDWTHLVDVANTFEGESNCVEMMEIKYFMCTIIMIGMQLV